MQIRLTSLMVNDQEKALDFYTRVLGFEKKNDIPMGPFRWLTVVSPQDTDGTELVLEPLAFPPAITFQQALFEAGIPATAFQVGDLDAEHARLSAAGVVFRTAPTVTGPVKGAVLEDSVGNNIQLYQVL
jgi:catechol 2,3-dioxygenase-like lactoylglutathione lyase family enzyme